MPKLKGADIWPLAIFGFPQGIYQPRANMAGFAGIQIMDTDGDLSGATSQNGGIEISAAASVNSWRIQK